MKTLIDSETIYTWFRDKWRGFTYPFRRVWYRLRLFRRFMKTPYFGQWEVVYPLFDYPFEIFCEFYEHCVQGTPYLDPDSFSDEHGERTMAEEQNEVRATMDKLYIWYTYIKPLREEEQEYLLSLWSEHFVSWFEEIEDPEMCGYFEWCSAESRYGKHLHELYTIEVNDFEREVDEMLAELVRIRRACWD